MTEIIIVGCIIIGLLLLYSCLIASSNYDKNTERQRKQINDKKR